MGVCGADPVCVIKGMDNLSPIGADERGTLDRLGYADSTRMACCARIDGPVEVSANAGASGRAGRQDESSSSTTRTSGG